MMKRILALLISVLPFNLLRSFAYRKVFGYKIISSQIGFGTILVVEKADIIHSKIGRFNLFLGPMKIIIQKNTSIGTLNRFQCDSWTIKSEYRYLNLKRTLKIGENTRISRHHYFDVAGSIIIKKDSWIAGCGSQFWTHGGSNEKKINIGKNCYIGSAVRFAPGAQIGNNVAVALGSVVTKKITKDNVLIGGVPAVVIKEDYKLKQSRKTSAKTS